MVWKIKKIHVFLTIVLILAISGLLQFSSLAKEKEHLQPLPVIMYHQITQNKKRCGKYAVTLEQFEEDMKYIKEKGYHTITVTQLLNYIDGKGKLPENPIMVTLDDGFESVYAYVYPLLKKMNMCAIASIVGSYTDFFTDENDHNLNYSYMTWAEVKELTAGNVIEIQCHTYDLHKICDGRKGAAKCQGEDMDCYKSVLVSDIDTFRKKITEAASYMPNTFTYPYGCYSKESKDLLKEQGFKAAFVCEEKINHIDPKNTEWLYRMGRYNRDYAFTTEKFFDNIFEKCKV